MDCSICQRKIENKNGWEHGNNAAPINNGRCCDFCNKNVVIPARFFLAKKHDSQKEKFK